MKNVIALGLVACAVLTSINAEAGQNPLLSRNFYQQCDAQLMAVDAAGGTKDEAYNTLVVCAEKAQIDVYNNLGDEGLVKLFTEIDTIYDDIYPSKATAINRKLVAEAKKTPGARQKLLDEKFNTMQYKKEGWTAKQMKKIEAEKQQQYAKAQRASQVNHGTPQERLDAMQACQADYSVDGYKQNKVQLETEYNSQFNSLYRDMIGYGYSSADAAAQARQSTAGLHQAAIDASKQYNAAIRNCAKQNYGIDLY